MRKIFWSLLISLLIGHSSWAKGTYIVSDAASRVRETTLPMQWRAISPAKGDHQVQGITQVEVKLDTRPWRGQTARIYMALPPATGHSIQAQWTTQNSTLLSGQLSSGQRTLVFNGQVPGDLLEDLMTVTLQTDGRQLRTTELVRFHFEIDVP